MNFCRHCGSALAPPPPQRPGGPIPGARAPMAPAGAPVMATPVPPVPDFQTCPRCGTQAHAGLAFCQQCGAMLPTVPGGNPATRAARAAAVAAQRPPATAPEPLMPAMVGEDEGALGSSPGTPPHAAPAAVLTSPGGGHRPAPQTIPGTVQPVIPGAGSSRPLARTVSVAPAARTAPAWGVLYAVRRDGTDGQSFPLSGEWVEIGRQGADLTFDDRHLAGRHARFEQIAGGGCRVVPIDLLNGVYRRIRAAHVLPGGTHFLIGRELLRFDVVEDDERQVTPLVRHGVALFGSPPRAPWGRLVQLLANGSIRDVRHLFGSEAVLGREDGDVVFRDDEFLSRRHATLRWQGGQCVLEDLKSSNGTFIRLRGPQPLEHGDTLRMGDQMFRLELEGA